MAFLDRDNDDDEKEVGMSQHLFEQLSCFVNPNVDVSAKIQKAKALQKYIQELDGFLSFNCEASHEGQLPALEWNGNFRKCYTVLLWVRPVLGGEKHTTIMEDNDQAHARRILYRFASSHDDANALGVSVNVGDWRVLTSDEEEDLQDSTSSKKPKRRKIQTTLMAYSLPNAPPTPLGGMDDNAPPYVAAPLELIENEWALIGITHVYPYLKRPHWTVCVNGGVAASGELQYPVLDRTPVMQFNTLFRNVVQGGAIVHNTTPDFKKTASELQTMVYPRLKLSLHLASFCISREALSSTIQALLAHAGPTLALQQNGALPTLPPVANWSKGSSLEGPNVGIPLVVHGQALNLQQLAGTAILWGSAVTARLLGANDPSGRHSSIQRIVVRMPNRPGTTQGVHRVGLIQPTAPAQAPRTRSTDVGSGGSEDDAVVSLAIVGSCSVHHNLSDYLLHSPDVTNVDTQLFHCTKHFSLLMEGQQLDCQLLLPFFLALPPPGTTMELQEKLYHNSAQHLFSLYHNDGAFAAYLLELFTDSVITGGGRYHEHLLQNGSLHVLASSLRQSLVRAELLQVYKYSTLDEFLEFYNTKPTVAISAMTSLAIVTPSRIPPSIASACARLINACCGPPALFLDDLSPGQQIQRTSDVALTALFGLALDLELWGMDVDACALILECVAERYGGCCVTAGYIVRSQISVQYLLDIFKSQLDRVDAPASKALERIANAGARILQAMLLSSLSNRRSISQGEHDVSACMGALSDCPLGSVGGHVIFTALMGVLQWCEIFPAEDEGEHGKIKVDEDHKLQVSARLCRNLLMGQFHDVVAPMLLSRTVFCGERSMSKATSTKTGDKEDTDSEMPGSVVQDGEKAPPPSFSMGTLSWQNHWRLALLIFSWIASIAGPEGFIASRSLGSLLLASGLAGSLKGALNDADNSLVSALFLPPPTMALTIAATTRRNEWSYTDLLSDRLDVMMPLLPGLVVSILSHPSDVTAQTKYSKEALQVLSNLLTAVGGAFYRVFGGSTHSAVTPTNNTKSGNRGGIGSNSRLRMAVSGAVKAAKEYVPHMLVVAMILENHIDVRKSGSSKSAEESHLDKPVQVLRTPTIQLPSKRAEDDASWLEVSSTVNESFLSDGAVEVPEGPTSEETTEALLARLSACQGSIMTTVSELMSSAMRVGGGEASTLLWRSVLSTLKDSVAYAARDAKDGSSGGADVSASTTEGNSQDNTDRRKSHAEGLAHSVLCRLAAHVLVKSLRRDSQWEVWAPNLSSAVSRLCLLVEEKELLLKPLGREPSSPEGHRPYTNDQILLLSALLNVLSYGRDTTGWCQLILPTPPMLTPKSMDSHGDMEGSSRNTEASYDMSDPVNVGLKLVSSSRSGDDDVPPMDAAPGASKLMLPVLQPALRVLVESVGNVRPSTLVIIPTTDSTELQGSEDKRGADEDEGIPSSFVAVQKEPLLQLLLFELQETLTAAIVGMSFPNARDVALQALASLRRAMMNLENSGEADGAALCSKLLCQVVEEIRVRYEGERRRRETALFDAYEDEAKLRDESDASALAAAADAREIEKLILGGDLIPPQQNLGDVGSEQCGDLTTGDTGQSAPPGSKPSDGEKPARAGNDDFVLFHEAYADGSGRSADENRARMEWSRYGGLGSALEECSTAKTSDAGEHDSHVKKVLEVLTPYLDAWDESAAQEAAESELVSLFDFSISPAASAEEEAAQQLTNELQQLPILGSETAADSMSTFIEFAAVEKSRLEEVTASFLPSHRHSSVAFAERFCWARYQELAGDYADMSELWERGIADGNRDIRSRLVSIPCNPQFKRYIPKYLDHSADMLAESNHSVDLEPNSFISSEPEETDAQIQQSNVDQFTKTLLETAHLSIVDITKKEVVEEDEPELLLPSASSMDDDGLFNDEPLELVSSSDRSEEPSKDQKEKPPASDAESTTETSATADETTQPDTVDTATFEKIKLGSSHFNITSSAFSSPPDNSSSTLSLIHSAAAGMIEQHLENCLHVKAEGSRRCSMFLTATHLILEYDADAEGLYEGELMAVKEEAERHKLILEAGGPGNSAYDEERIQEALERRQRETAALRPKSIRWNLSELSHVYLRRYRLRDSALEMFFIPSGGTSFGGYGLYSPSTSLFLDFGPGYEGNTRRDDAGFAIMKRAPPQAIKQWPDRFGQFLHEQLSRLTMGWVEGRITNFDYLLHLNMLAGRSYNDICQYPVMPWVLANYRSEEIPDLCDPKNFRDLTKPMGALNPSRLEDFIERFSTFADPSIPPFMYGSHYSTSAGVVLHFLVRLHPFAGLHRQLQGGHFDVADRLFSSVPRTWEMCTGTSAAEVKELTPEWYCNPAFLKNTNKFKLGTSQDGELLGDVALPPWAKGKPETFVEVMRNALESDICSEMLPDWIDLIFGRKQQGPEAIKAHNVFFYLTYYGSVDVASIEDEALRQATELQIAHFGQCPMQLFVRPHVRRIQLYNYRRMSFYQIVSAYTHGAGRADEEKDNNDSLSRVFGEPLCLPFFSSPISHWVHLDALPPGPHAPLVAVRLAGTDRCLAVDAQGVFHCFRWAWKAEEDRVSEGGEPVFPIDQGCFVAQRELPRFRTVPRLVHRPRPDEVPAVAISKTLFAGRSVLLVISDGDGRGGLAMQLVDPAKGTVRGEAVVGAVHSGQITAVATDPIGTAAGHGGVGGELAIVGSLDGCASIWRFMSSHYLPLRPRVRLGGHGGAKVCAVGLNAAIHVAATVSSDRCCLHSIGNGNLIRRIDPPSDTLDLPEHSDFKVTTRFADTAALAISVQGFVVTVCETRLNAPNAVGQNRSVITLHLFSLEGVSLGSKPLENWRGVPHKMQCTPDGTAVLVCSGRGVTVHRLSAITPLEFIDEWHITETEELTTSVAQAWDVDLGPSLNRPVVAAAACSSGALRLHALAGISAFSERHKKSGITETVSSALARPARRLRNAMGKGFGFGTKVVGVGKEIGKEVTSDVKERGVGGFLGGMMFRKSSN